MVCIHCGGKTQVVNSRSQRRLNQVWRRRQCLSCGAVFTTEEGVQYGAVWGVIDSSGTLSPFSRDKLLLSILNSLQHRQEALSTAVALTNTVMHKLQAHGQDGTLQSSLIAHNVQVALNRFDKAASVHYAAFHKKR